MHFTRRTASVMAVLLLVAAALGSSVTPAAAVDADLMALWSLDNGSGTAATDAIGGHDGTLINGPTWGFGILGYGGLEFDGVDDIVTVGSEAVFRPSGSASVDLWVKPTAMQDATLMLNGSGEGTTWNIYIGLKVVGEPEHLVVQFDLFASGGIKRMTGTAPLGLGQWSHVVVVFDGDAQTMYTYVNGAPDTSMGTGSSTLMTGFQWVHPMGLGNNYRCDGAAYPAGCSLVRPLAGFLDEVAFYSRALSSVEIAEQHAGLPVFCHGKVATLAGTDGPDTLTGTSGRDVILGRDGDDVIIGGDGRDLICGGPGADTLSGEDGKDRLEGGPGPDVLSGGANRDTILGNGGSDLLSGNRGADVLRGGFGDDVIAGGSKDDLLRGGQGDDELFGGSGDDELLGGAGTDEANGQYGTDTCDAESEVSCEV